VRYISNIFNRIASKGMILAGVFIVGMMCLTVANVIVRFFGQVIAGTYELTEIMHVVVIGCAFGYTILKGSQVTVDLVVSHLPSRFRGILEVWNSFLGMTFWGLIVWASLGLTLDRWLDEKTQMLRVPFLPFRFVWVVGLTFAALVYAAKLFKAINGREKK
jgi:TRAP-type C4-dicarboxylate transport system permease small subunit